METVLFNPYKDRSAFYKWASSLALITVFYNLLEGIVSVFFGIQDGAVTLFGFGVDSFVEVISGIGIWHMIRRYTVQISGLACIRSLHKDMYVAFCNSPYFERGV